MVTGDMKRIIYEYCSKIFLFQGRRGSSEGGRTITNAQEGSTVNLVGLDWHNLFRAASVRPNAQIGSPFGQLTHLKLVFGEYQLELADETSVVLHRDNAGCKSIGNCRELG